MKLFKFKDKDDGETSELAFLNVGRIVTDSIFEQGKKSPIKLGFYLYFFVPFTTKIREYVDPNTYKTVKGLTKKRVGIKLRKHKYDGEIHSKYVKSCQVIDYPLTDNK